MIKYLKYLVVGIFFGIVLSKAEVIYWWRIREMFLFKSFHMYGIIGSAVLVGMVSVWCIKRFQIKTIAGEEVKIVPKTYHKGYFLGGTLFGLGWALTGACPGPMFVLLGNGYTVFSVTILFALLGTFTYGLVRNKLPH
jgi:uncharacterized membrane protein YedE/YeeE